MKSLSLPLMSEVVISPLFYAKLGCLTLAALAVVGCFRIAKTVPLEPPARLGYRGAARQRALAAGGLFRRVEPVIRFVAGCIRGLPLAQVRQERERDLRQAAYPLGLSADEYLALTVLSAGALSFIVAGFVAVLDASPVWILPAVVYGTALPSLQVRQVRAARVKQIVRRLPPAMEIAAMCMGAGQDFPGALRLLAQEEDPLSEEFRIIMEELDLGRTRKEALLAFADRVPSEAVGDFVRAVVQAEQKGNPLARAIQVQARMQNLRRSVAAEQAAARAGVLMVGPMMLLLGAILILLVGPFTVGGLGF